MKKFSANLFLVFTFFLMSMFLLSGTNAYALVGESADIFDVVTDGCDSGGAAPFFTIVTDGNDQVVMWVVNNTRTSEFGYSYGNVPSGSYTSAPLPHPLDTQPEDSMTMVLELWHSGSMVATDTFDYNCGDGDGIDDLVEENAPNDGDGNDDGTPDRDQQNVTSMPAATGNGYLTLQTTCPNQNVQTFLESDLAEQDQQYNYNYGLIGFELPCENATVRVYYHGTGQVPTTYRKYGPLFPDFGPPEWYAMPGVIFAQQTIPATGGVPTWYAEFALCDGCIGDDTGDDGVIYDQGGVSQALDVPTMNEWGMVIFMVLAGAGAVYYVRRRRALS